MVEEIPIVVRTSPLLGRLLGGMEVDRGRYAVTEMAGGGEIVEEIIEKVEMYRNEEQNVGYVLRQIGRERGRAEAYLQKRKEESALRVSQGLPPLPEEDVSRMFKIPNEPSRLENVVLLAQLDGMAGELAGSGAGAGSGLDMVKLYGNYVQ
jgi:translation initiation factor 3 subunit H